MEISAKPLIYVTKDSEIKLDPKSLFKRSFLKILFIVLGAIIIGELIWGVRSIISSQNAFIPSISELSEGSIVVDSPKVNYQVGEAVPITIRVATGGKLTDAADLILKYDPKVLSLVSSDIKIGQIYKDYPVADNDQSLGEVKVSGITPPAETGFGGIGELASLQFKALSSGKTVVSVDFQKDSTIDSNIVEANTTHDMLVAVYNKELFIGSSQSTIVEKDNKNQCQGYIQLCQTSENQTGRQFCQQGRIQNSQCKFDPNLTISCDECRVSQ